MPEVAFIKCRSYSANLIDQAVQGCFDAFPGFLEKVKPGTKILIKPNLLLAKEPEKAITTHPELVRAVAVEMVKRGAEVYIGDSPGGRNSPGYDKNLYLKTGMIDACGQSGARAYYFNAGETIEVKNETGVLYKSFTLAKIVEEADLIISLPKLKTHGFMTLTLAVKNNFGCLPGYNKPLFHIKVPEKDHFADMLVDLGLTVKPDFVIVDAVVGMEGDGPSSGKPREIGLLIAGDDQFAIDWETSRMLGVNPLDVPVNRAAAKRSLVSAGGNRRIGDGVEVKISGFKLPAGSLFDKIPGFLSRFAKKRLTPRPVVDRQKCIGCKVCYVNCYSKAIKWEQDCPVFLYDICIRCYCCHELCPEKAISLKAPGFFR